MSSNQIALKALAQEGISMSEGELLRAVTALSESRQRTRQGPTRAPGRLCEPSIQTRVRGVHAGWLIATFCMVGIGVLAAVTIVLAMELAEDTENDDIRNEDTGIYGEQPISSSTQSRSSDHLPCRSPLGIRCGDLQSLVERVRPLEAFG